MILKLRKIEIFSVNVTEKLGGYSKFPEEGNLLDKNVCRGLFRILRPF